MSLVEASRLPPSMSEQQVSARAWLALRLLVLGLVLAAGVVVVRVVQLQTDPDPRVARLVGSQRSTWSLQSRRGSLLDRHGRTVAVSRPAVRLFADPAIAGDLEDFACTVADQFGFDPLKLHRKLAARPEARYVVLDPKMSQARMARYAEMRRKPRGLGTQRWMFRSYPHGSLAGQVVGFVGREGHGLEGLERRFDARLLGQSGKASWYRDASRRPLWLDRRDYAAPVEGRHLRLSLDLVIQSIAEEELAARCEQYDAPSGQLVVMQPRTGEILAMANYPGFDPGDAAAVSQPVRDGRVRARFDV